MCSHSYCKIWVKTHFVTQINMKVIENTCPDWYSIIRENVVFDLLEDQEKLRFLEFKNQISIDRNPNLHWCPRIDWGKFVEIPKTKVGKKRKATCEWGQEFCIGCHMPWHNDKSCKNALDKGYIHFLDMPDVKKCPKCKTTIEKNDGWNHMTCHVCTYQFWWLWGDRYTSDHYDGFGGWSSHGKGITGHLILCCCLPLILLLFPMILFCAWTSHLFKKWKTIGWIIILSLFWIFFIMGFAFEVFLPFFYVFFAFIAVRTLWRQSRFRS